MFKYTEKKLAKELGQIARSINPEFRDHYDPDEQRVVLRFANEPDREGPSFFLTNLLRKVADLSKKDRRKTLEVHVRESLGETTQSPDDYIYSLTLRVRTAFEINFRKRHIESMGHEAPEPVVVGYGDVLLEVVSDGEQTVSIATFDSLAQVGVTRDEAFRIAEAKIHRVTDRQPWTELAPSIYQSHHQDDYDFVRLIASEGRPPFPFDGPPIIYAPSHAVCLCTDRTDPGTLLAMINRGDEAAATHRPLSQLLWTLGEDAQWTAWEADKSTPESAVADTQSLKETTQQYSETREILQKTLGEDVYVAQHQAMQRDGEIVCLSVYSLNVPTYLPKTDVVMLVDPEVDGDAGVLGRVTWEELAASCDSLEVVEGTLPAWYQLLPKLTSDESTRLRSLVQPFE